MAWEQLSNVIDWWQVQHLLLLQLTAYGSQRMLLGLGLCRPDWHISRSEWHYWTRWSGNKLNTHDLMNWLKISFEVQNSIPQATAVSIMVATMVNGTRRDRHLTSGIYMDGEAQNTSFCAVWLMCEDLLSSHKWIIVQSLKHRASMLLSGLFIEQFTQSDTGQVAETGHHHDL